MSEARVIKRYANRKLYDTQHSCYVTLDQIAEMIRAGEDVRILDNRSKEDLTSVTLAQIIFEEEKKRRLLPLVGLKKLIQTSGDSLSEFVTQVKGGVDRGVGRVFRRGGESEAAGSADPGEPGGPDAAAGEEGGSEAARADAIRDVVEAAAPGAGAVPDGALPESESPKTVAAMREFLDSSQKRLDEWQSLVDEQLHKLVGNLSPLTPLQKELAAVMGRLDDLEARLSSLESRIGPSAD